MWGGSGGLMQWSFPGYGCTRTEDRCRWIEKKLVFPGSLDKQHDAEDPDNHYYRQE